MDRGSPPLLRSWQILRSYSRRDLASTVRESSLLPYLAITNRTPQSADYFERISHRATDENDRICPQKRLSQYLIEIAIMCVK